MAGWRYPWDMIPPKKKTPKRKGRPPRPISAAKRGRRPKSAAVGGPEVRKAFARRLTALMEDLGLSQTGFAALVDVTSTNVRWYADAKVQPGFDVLYRIATRTHASLDWLLGGPGDKPVYRGEWRTTAVLESDVAGWLEERFRRAAQDGKFLSGEHYARWRADGARALEALAEREIAAFREFRAWERSTDEIETAVQRVRTERESALTPSKRFPALKQAVGFAAEATFRRMEQAERHLLGALGALPRPASPNVLPDAIEVTYTDLGYVGRKTRGDLTYEASFAIPLVEFLPRPKGKRRRPS
jgi:transcriptional regulator with XRE-family HTH domain